MKTALDSYGLICDTDSDLKGRLNSTINQVEIHILARNILMLKLDMSKLKVLRKIDIYDSDESWFWFYAKWLVEDMNEADTNQAVIIMERILQFYDRHFFLYGRWIRSEWSLLYGKFVETLLSAFYKDVTNYELIVSFLQRLLRGPSKCSITSTLDFIEYLLQAACSQQFDISDYERQFVNFGNEVYSDHYLASFSQLFSMLDAYIEGNLEWATLLLEYGCQIFANSWIVPNDYTSEFSLLTQMVYAGRISEGLYYTLVAMMFYRFKAAQERIFVLIWRNLPFPIVNNQSIIRLRTQLGEVLSTRLNLAVLQDTFGRRFRIFAERTYEPRSLKHLCRCCIRQILNAKFALPAGIKQLRLPKDLNEYLNFKDYLDLNNLR